MLRLKQKATEAAAAAAAAAAVPAAPADSGSASAAPSDSSAAAAPAAVPGDQPKKISLLGGDEGRKASAGGPRKRMKPGEIRVQKDIAELDVGKVGKIEFPVPEDLTSMELTVSPDQGLWKGGKFKFSIKVPDMYPHEPPKVMCLTKIYHPNIDLEGHVCLNILRDDWKPVLDINSVIYGIVYLFYEPNPNDPLNQEAAALFRDNRDQFVKNVNTALRGGRVGMTTFPRLIM